MTLWRIGTAGLLVLAVGVPLAMPLVALANEPSAWHALAEGPRLVSLARNTFFLAAGTLALALPAGTALAYLLYRTDLPGRRFLRGLTVVALFVPLPLFASGWQAALGSGGWLALPAWTTPDPGDPDVTAAGSAWKPWAQGLGAAIWIHAIAALPWVVLLAGQGFCWVERELEEDAATAAGPWAVFRAVTLRRAGAALLAAAAWVALQTATEVSVTDLLQVRTFAEEVFDQFVRPPTDGSVPSAEAAVANAVAVSLPATGLALLAAWRVAWRVERGLPPLERLASTAPRLASLGRWRWPALFALGGLAGLLAAVPLGSLVWKAGSAGPVWGWPTLAASLDKAIEIRGLMVLRSIGVALAAGALAADLALVACWLATESRWLRRLTLGLAVATWVLPGPVLGIGLKETISCLLGLFPFDPLATALYHGPSYLPVLWAYALRFFPAAVALLWPVVRLLPAELRDAARVEGAGPGSEFRYVVWPLTRRAWLRAALAVAVLSLGELGASKLVETPGSVTFAHEVFAQMHFGVTSDLAALCLLLLAAAALGGGLIAVLTRSERS